MFRGTLKYEVLDEALHLGKLGRQVVLKSKKAFDNLVTNSISIRSSFKFRELLNGTNIYTA